ncbi:hypothetical protein BEL04_20665 [Mucilaginibacter sp. PPCGB 2223]|uniref:SusD/RagB family nutrient-binding outer membrane lipoprotein n=1 Tax=Mucilaginibacter sp. PPCGB 2223 TaxID=1886027 RepID=UPI000826F705|nr:SusD/RagB family nutrient-binding outer membrane lipoprotein [Mucilaginibacter sp. PPCGB 2223]OCX51125.1 hypothetical protein BEL04_20665 [Mucilaginibacter sp. PPCGB 2223]
MKKIKYTILAALTLCTASSCKKYVDVNNNPNAPVAVSASALMPSMLAGMERGVWFDSRFVGQYAQIWGSSASQNVWDQEGYAVGSDSGGEIWRSVYFSLGANTGLLWQDAIPKQQWDYVGAGWAMRAWGWQAGADEYNNMIVKEAFDPSRLTFDYDVPEDVYAEVVKDAQMAINYFNLAINTDHLTISPALKVGDYMYYGDRTKWIKFCYAILAKNQLHLTNKSIFNPTLVAKYVDSSFVSNADNASIKNNGSVSGDSNFWGPLRANLGSFRQSDFIVRLLDGRIFTGSSTPNNTLDPRINILIAQSKDGVYRGVIGAGADPNSADANTLIPYLFSNGNGTGYTGAAYPSNAGTTQKYIYNDNARGVLDTYAEVQFFKAEALFKKGDLAGAYTAYINGITGSLDFCSNPPQGDNLTGTQNVISAAAKTAYLTGPCVKQSAATLTLADILQQKFIALYVWGAIEAWCDERRYSYDTSIFQGFQKPSPLYPDNAGKQVYLLRPRYNSEYIWNVPALNNIGALAPDYHTKKPWFILP